MKSKTNYSILSEKSDFLKYIVSKHILALNQADGVFPDRSLFGAYILVGDKEEAIPNKKYVISFVERTDFKILDIDADPLVLLYEILEIDSKDYKLFVRNKVYSNKSVNLNSLYYYMILLKDCIKEDKTLNMTKAELIINSYKYASKSSTFDKYRALNSYVLRPDEESLFEVIKVFSDTPDNNKRFTGIAYVIKCIIDGSVPSYIESRLSFSQDPAVLMQYIILASEVALFEDFDTFISNLISKLV